MFSVYVGTHSFVLPDVFRSRLLIGKMVVNCYIQSIDTLMSENCGSYIIDGFNEIKIKKMHSSIKICYI